MRERIAIFVNDLTVSGLSRTAINLSDGFEQLGYNVDLLLVSAKGDLHSSVPEHINIVELGSGKFELRRSMLAYLKEESPDRLYSITAHYIPLQTVALSSTNVSLYLIQGTIRSGRTLGLKKYLKYRIMENLFFHYAKGVIATSESVAKDISDFAPVPYDKIEIVGNPVDIKQIEKSSSKTANHRFYQDDMPLILGAGHLRELKDYSTLIESMETVLRDIDANLLILGEGSQRESLLELARSLGIEDNVDIIDFVNDPYPYMRGASVFAHPSQSEGFGNVIVEALACGTPTVVTDCPGGPSEIVNNTDYGGVIPVGDPQLLAEEILRLLNNPPSSAKAVSRAEDYSITSITERYEEIHNSNQNQNRS